MAESVVPCPACGAPTAVAPAGAAPCPGCGFVVSARARVRAASDDAPARRGPGLAALLLGGLLVLAAGGAAVYAYLQRKEAEAFERRARLEAELAQEQRAWEREQAVRRRAELAALPAALPGLMPGVVREPADAEKLGAELGKKAVGVWRGAGPDGGVREVEYRADGTYRDRVTGAGGREWVGTWSVAGATGTRVLRLTRVGGGPRAVRLSFEGDELIHDDEPGRATVLRKN